MMPPTAEHEQEERLLNDTAGNAHEQAQLQQADGLTPPPVSDAEHRRICRRLYISHALSTWNSRLFEFGAFLFFATLYPKTLLPASVYALARAASAALLSPWLGRFIDKADRLKAVRLSIIWQRLPVVLSCVIFAVLFRRPPWMRSTVAHVLAVTILSLLACLEKLSAVLNTIAVERDWTVVIAGTDEPRLATMNAQMRRIDLFCKLAAPLTISLIDSAMITYAFPVYATAAMSATSVFAEYLAIARVYRAVPALRAPKSPTACPSAEENPSVLSTRQSHTAILMNYVRHPAFLPSFALALLYLTVLSFSGQFITYLLVEELSGVTVAGLRAVAAVFELSATWLAPWLHSRIGAVRAGIWFLNIELVFIVLSCALLWLQPVNLPHHMVVYTVVLSRVGLWGFDLSAQLIIQDEVEPDMRGTFSSLEASFQNGFEMLAFLSTVIFPRPEQFAIPATMSALAVATAAVLYASFVRGRRGHLLHASKCFDRHKRSKQSQDGFVSIPLEEQDNAEEEPRD